MYRLIVLSCLAALFYSSASLPTNDLKPEPVDLAHSCLRVSSGDVKSNDQAPILLLHALGLSKESWMGVYQVLAMRTNRKVCIADLRNHGDSPWSDETTVTAMVEDVSRLLDTLKIPKVILLGHSLGGKVSMHFSLNHPDKVEKLIVEDMRPNGVNKETLYVIKYFLMLLETSIKAIPEGADEPAAKKAVELFLEQELAKINATGIIDEKGVEFLPIKCSDGKCRWKTNVKVTGQILKNVAEESTGRFDGPTLFVYGTESPIKVQDDESSILKLFPQAKFAGIEGASHYVHKYREFLDPVIKFINAED